MVKCIRPGAIINDRVPNPLHQELPPPNSVHIVRSSAPPIGQQLPRIRPAAAGAVDPLAQVGNLGRERRVRARVPRVHQRIRRHLGQLVADHADHAVHAYVAVGRLLGCPGGVARVGVDGERVGADARALGGRVAHPRVRHCVAHDGWECEVVEAADLRSAVQENPLVNYGIFINLNI